MRMSMQAVPRAGRCPFAEETAPVRQKLVVFSATDRSSGQFAEYYPKPCETSLLIWKRSNLVEHLRNDRFIRDDGRIGERPVQEPKRLCLSGTAMTVRSTKPKETVNKRPEQAPPDTQLRSWK